MKSYTAWLHFSLICVGLPAVVFAWLGLQFSVDSSYRVERGRIASDIYSALISFDHSKAQLRIWSYEQGISDRRDPATRRDILDAMEAQASEIRNKTQAAIALDQQQYKALQEHQDREALFILLRAVIDKLEAETAARLVQEQPELAELVEMDAEFEQLGDISLAVALS
ncbi:MAG: hypothetical protein IIX61_05635, partial [Loktanella sp.]|nr:hypothetical protein [Loktanella sp.]